MECVPLATTRSAALVFLHQQQVVSLPFARSTLIQVRAPCLRIDIARISSLPASTSYHRSKYGIVNLEALQVPAVHPAIAHVRAARVAKDLTLIMTMVLAWGTWKQQSLCMRKETYECVFFLAKKGYGFIRVSCDYARPSFPRKSSACLWSAFATSAVAPRRFGTASGRSRRWMRV